ncbi:MAG: hypothetical protein ACERJ2_07735 [Filomicrobium sp.]
MLKFVAAALAAAVVVTGMPIQSEAGHARSARGDDCRLCKMFTHTRVRATTAVRAAPRSARRMFTWPKFQRVRSESLFRLAPRQPRPAVRAYKRTERRAFTWPKFRRVRSESLFKLAPREPRPVVTRTRREWKPLFATRRAPARAATRARAR